MLALRAAQALVAPAADVALPDVARAARQAQVLILGQIGRPLDDPQVATAALCPADGTVTDRMRAGATAVLNDQLEQIDALREEILNGRVALF